MKTKKTNIPLTKKIIGNCKHGDYLELSGEIFVGRDQVHCRLAEMHNKNIELPCNLKNSVIFYAGPSPTPPGKIIGSIGPTTSARMDIFTELMLKLGINCFIGKGTRANYAMQAIENAGALYCVTFGGYAALLSSYILKNELIAFPELGAEALLKLTIKNIPVIVIKK